MNSTFDSSPYPPGSILDDLYQKYHTSGFSAQYLLQYHGPQFLPALVNILLNLSFIFVAIKSRSTHHNPFNIFIAFESFTSVMVAFGFLFGYWLPISGKNVARVEICILLRCPSMIKGSMQNAMTVFISLERLICIQFPILYRNILIKWKHFYIRAVLFLDVTIGGIMAYLLFSNTLDSNHYYLCNFGDFLNADGRNYLYRGNMFLQILALFIYAIIFFLMIKARIQRVKLMEKNNMQILRSLNVIMAIIFFGWLISTSTSTLMALFKIPDSDWPKIFPFISSTTILACSLNGPVLFALSQEYRKCYQYVFPWLLKIRRNQIQSTTPVQVIHNN